MLDARKIAILTEIVDYYIDHAEPIGSRTLSKNPTIGLSPATIRNEMSDLEELGYLTKTHISSGRIPSDKAYRIYVNSILDDEMKLNRKFINSMKKDLIHGSTSLREFYESANKLLSQKTNYITVIISPVANSFTIEYVKLEMLASNRLLLILVGSRGSTSSYVLDNITLKEEEFLILEKNLISLLIKKDFNELKKEQEKIPDSKQKEIYLKVLEMALEFLEEQNSYNVFLNGIGNILNFWSGDMDNVKALIDFLEDDRNLIEYSLQREIDKILDIRIGEENDDGILRETSVISSNYANTTGNLGNIILIGPTRMDYRKLANILYNFSVTLSGL
ncbi:MAG: heat-inducible transcription repressor HrcA [Tissierellia bacterium]|jgi:heat-inducible transcriptional repressor|nr:heat-inducible transcription repressor HrcA [Tissierellia bacterium]